jgi:hypothetical protein
MAKNKRFTKRYVITVDGTTTNEFASELIEKFLKNMEQSLDTWFKQVNVTIRDYNEEPVEKIKD